tara:strand:+ start:519 stop:845 length:327 start_codon:yes stop_codon:yes gene_type:complete
MTDVITYLESKVRTTPISGGGSLYAQSLIARGFADTRATKIGEAIDNNDMSALAYAIGACDSYYYPWLIENEPVLFLYFIEQAPHMKEDINWMQERIRQHLEREDDRS